MRVLYSDPQSEDLVHVGHTPSVDLQTLRRQLRSYQTSTETWWSPVIDGEYEDAEGIWHPYRPQKLVGEHRTTYLSTVALPTLKAAQEIVDRLISAGFDSLRGTTIELVFRKTTRRHGTCWTASKRIVLYPQAHNEGILVHELAHIVALNRYKERCHGWGFKRAYEDLLKVIE